MKNKGKVSLILIILMVIILVLIGYIVFDKFILNANSEGENISSNDSEVSNQVVLNEKKNMITSDEDKIAINNKLKDSSKIINLILSSKKIKGEFSDDEKIIIASFVASEKDKENFTNNSQGEPFSKTVNKEYLKAYSESIFEKEIDYEKSTYSIENDKIKVEYPSGFGISVYKVKSLFLNEKTNEYTLTVDSLNIDKISDALQDYLNVENIEYKEEYVDYTFTLKYKEINGNYLLVSLEK